MEDITSKIAVQLNFTLLKQTSDKKQRYHQKTTFSTIPTNWHGNKLRR